MNMYRLAGLGMVVTFAIAACDASDSQTRADRQDAPMTQSVDEAEDQKRSAESEFAAMESATEQSRADLATARTEALYATEAQRCRTLAGNDRDVCLKEAERTRAEAISESKLARDTAEANQTATDTVADAREEAADTMQDADYGLAVEKCDGYSGDVRNACIEQAKADFAQN